MPMRASSGPMYLHALVSSLVHLDWSLRNVVRKITDASLIGISPTEEIHMQPHIVQFAEQTQCRINRLEIIAK